MLAEAAFAAVDCPALQDWVPGRDGVAVILDLSSDGARDALAEFVVEHPHIPVVAVLEELVLAEYAAAIRAGARAAVGEDEPTDAIVTVLQLALEGRTAVPFSVIDSMAARVPAAPDPNAWVSDDEAVWLRRLADGETVAGLAAHVGYSEREMFRTLHDLYVRIGVRNRTEAIIWATRHGVLDGTA